MVVAKAVCRIRSHRSSAVKTGTAIAKRTTLGCIVSAATSLPSRSSMTALVVPQEKQGNPVIILNRQKKGLLRCTASMPKTTPK